MPHITNDHIMEDLARQSNGGAAKPQVREEDDKFKEVFLDSAYDNSNFIGKFVHLWKFRYYLKHYRSKRLTLKDITRLPTADESEKQYNILEKYITELNIIQIENAKICLSSTTDNG